MFRQELEKMNPSVMCKQMQRCLETYNEEVASVYKRKFDEVLEVAEAQLEDVKSTLFQAMSKTNPRVLRLATCEK
jgi:hypothetical protein